MSLTPEQIREIEEFEARVAAEEGELTPEQIQELEEFQSAEEPEVSTIESGIRGAAQELTFGFADEIEAIADTAVDQVLGNTELSISENFDQNLEQSRAEFAAAKDRHRVAYGAGQVAGFGASIALGAGAAKATGLAVKGVKSAAALGAAQGALQSFGSSEDKMSNESIKDALLSAGFGGAVGGGAQKLFSSIAKSDSTQDFVRKRVYQAFGITTKPAKKKIEGVLRSQGKNMTQWVDDLSNEKVVKLLDDGSIKSSSEPLFRFRDSQADIVRKAEENIAVYDEARERLLKNIVVPDSSMVSKKVGKDISAVIDPANLGKAEYKAVQDILEDIDFRVANIAEITADKGEKLVSGPVNLMDIYRIRRGIDKKLNSRVFQEADPSTLNQIKIAARNSLNDFIDSSVDRSGIKGLTKDKEIRSKLQSLYTVKDAVEEDVTLSRSPWRMFSDAIATVVGATAGKAIGAEPAAIGASVLTLRRAAKSPRVNREMAIKISKLANAVENKGADAGKLVRRLAVASDLGPQVFGKVADGILGEEALAGDPIQRNVGDVINKQNHILAIARDQAPDLANALQEAIESNDQESIAASMDRISKQPAMKKFFIDGTGFNGRIYDPADAAQLTNEVNSLDIPHIDRLRAKNQIQKGIVPQIQVTPMAEKESIHKRKRNLY